MTDIKPRTFVVGIVDDDPSVLESLTELLVSGGYRVLAFSSAEEFLRSNRLEQVDCCISDICLPGVTGWELMRVARAEYPHLPVILISADDDKRSRAATERAHARFIFRKPFDGRELLMALDTIARDVG